MKSYHLLCATPAEGSDIVK
ncbi:hypothetical protein LINGRAHAP2_LOCUS20281 [Linum grandiflorum]